MNFKSFSWSPLCSGKMNLDIGNVKKVSKIIIHVMKQLCMTLPY